jgi:hypothetical protein
MAARMGELYAKHDPVDVVINPKSQTGTLVMRLLEQGIIAHEMTAQDVAVAHGEFLDLIDGAGLEHLPQKPLTNAVRAALERPLAGAKAWEPTVAIDQGPVIAATGAVWGFLRWEEVSAPSAFSM